MTAIRTAPAITSRSLRGEMGSLRTKLLYGFGSVGFGVKDQGFSYFLLFFYNQVVGAPSQMVGRAIAIALFVDAFADPIVGQISDNLRTRLGRRHPFMYAAVVPVAIAYYLLWNPPHWQGTSLFLYLLVVVIVVRTFITLYEIPSSALVAELTPDYDQRTSFLAWRYLFGWLGGIAMTLLAFGVFFAATKRYPVGQLNPEGYARYFVAGCALIVIAVLVSAAGTQKFIPCFSVPPSRAFSLARLAREMLETMKNRSFLVLTASALFAAVAAGTLTALNNYFNTFLWGLGARQILLLSTVIIAAPVVALFAAPFLSSRIGKKRAAMTFWILATAFYWFPMAARLADMFPANGTRWLLPLLALLTAIGTTFSIASAITITSMLADVVEDSQRRTHRRSEGLFFSANAFVLKAVSGVGIFVATELLELVHFPAHANPATLDPRIAENLALAYLPVTFVLYAVAFAFLTAYRIDRNKHEDNLRTLAAEAALASAPAEVNWHAP
jgi:GPH family glycoside/pentoside/hexuronide:cation symporter